MSLCWSLKTPTQVGEVKSLPPSSVSLLCHGQVPVHSLLRSTSPESPIQDDHPGQGKTRYPLLSSVSVQYRRSFSQD